MKIVTFIGARDQFIKFSLVSKGVLRYENKKIFGEGDAPIKIVQKIVAL